MRAAAKVGVAALGSLATAAIAAGGAVAGLVNETVNYIDKINTASKATGLSRETIAGLDQAAKATGKTLEQLVPKDLAQKMLQAEQGSSRALKAFKELGLEQADVVALNGDVDRTFRIVIDRLQAIDSEGTRAGVAAQLLGENGRQMLSAFSNSGDLDRFVDRARNVVDVSEDAVAAASSWQDATAKLQASLDSLKNATIQPMIPTVSRWVDNFTTGLAAVEVLAGGVVDKFMTLHRVNQALLEGNFQAAWNTRWKTSTELVEELKARVIELKGITAGGDGIEAIGGEGGAIAVKRVATELKEVKKQAVEARGAFDTLISPSFMAIQVAATTAEERMRALKEAGEAAMVSFVMAQVQSQVFSQEVHEAEKLNFKERMSMIDSEANARTASLRASLSMIQAQTDFLIKHLDTRTKRGKTAAKALFAINKAAAVATAVVNTALGITGALATPPPPLGIALAAVVGALGAFQIGVIAAQQPQFHIGMRATDMGAPDEYQATLRQNEKVVTALGDETIAAAGTANANAGVLGGSGAQVVYAVMDNAVAGKMVGTQLRPGTQLMEALRNEPVGHSRKRGTRG